MLRFEVWLFCALAVFAAGCGSNCQRVCDKLLECGDEGYLQTDRFSFIECNESCQRQADLFDGWEDEEEYREAWREHRRCLMREDCASIAAGACFDERFFIIGEE